MSKSYFYKELVSNGFLAAGKQPPFEVLSGNRGVIALDPATDGPMLEALDLAASEQRGGIVKISEAEYTEKKTLFHQGKTSGIPSRKDVLRIMPSAKDILKTPADTTAPVPTAANPAAPTEPNPHNPYGVDTAGVAQQPNLPPKPDPSAPKPVSIGQIDAPPPGTFETPKANVPPAAPTPDAPPAFKPKTGRTAAAAKAPAAEPVAV